MGNGHDHRVGDRCPPSHPELRLRTRALRIREAIQGELLLLFLCNELKIAQLFRRRSLKQAPPRCRSSVLLSLLTYIFSRAMWCIAQRVQAALHATIIRNGKVCSALSFLFWDRQRLMKYPTDQLTKNGSLVGVAAASMAVITIRTECFLIPIADCREKVSKLSGVCEEYSAITFDYFPPLDNCVDHSPDSPPLAVDQGSMGNP